MVEVTFRILIEPLMGFIKWILRVIPPLERLYLRGKKIYLRRKRIKSISDLQKQVREYVRQHNIQSGPRPVVVFNASAHKGDYTLFAVFTVLLTESLRLAGARVVNLVCSGGLSRCNIPVADRWFDKDPPCKSCYKTSQNLFNSSETEAFGPGARKPEIRKKIMATGFSELASFEYKGLPLGKIALTSVRWAVRKHNLEDSTLHRGLLAHHVASGVELADYFEEYLDRIKPALVFTFNGTLMSEAVVRLVCENKGVRFVSFEVGFRKENSLFITDGLATDVPIKIPGDYSLSAEEGQELERYLAGRFKGDFHVGGRVFWTDMQGVSAELAKTIEQYRQVVTIFTNVVFDTSQVSANTIFESMFDWLDQVLSVVREQTDTFFILRIHPEEARKSRPSREPVYDWIVKNQYADLPNLKIILPTEEISSYELMDRSKFCAVYNSTVGVEATIRGVPVLSGGASKYSREGFTYLPASAAAHESQFKQFLEEPAVDFPEHWVDLAKRYLYFLVYKHSLNFSQFINPAPYNLGGYMLTDFEVTDLLRENSPEIKILLDGLLEEQEFRYTGPIAE